MRHFYITGNVMYVASWAREFFSEKAIENRHKSNIRLAVSIKK